MDASNAVQSQLLLQTHIAQDDFGSLGLPVEPEDMSLEHVVDHPALSRHGSETSLMDLCCEFETNIADQLEELLKISRRVPRVRATPSSNVMRPLPLDQTTVDTTLPPPRRYARRFWGGLARRLTQLKRMRMLSGNLSFDSE